MPHAGPMASLSAPTTLFCVDRPISSSAIMIGRPTAAMHTRYTRTKAPPLFSHVMNGNFHRLPRPIALPVAARMKPVFERQWARGSDMCRPPIDGGVSGVRCSPNISGPVKFRQANVTRNCRFAGIVRLRRRVAE